MRILLKLSQGNAFNPLFTNKTFNNNNKCGKNIFFLLFQETWVKNKKKNVLYVWLIVMQLQWRHLIAR